MFSGFPHTLRRYGFDTDVRVLMELYRTMELGLITNLGSLFDIGQHLICKSRREIAPYTLAFWDHFLGIDSTNYNSLMMRSATLPHLNIGSVKNWRPEKYPVSLITKN